MKHLFAAAILTLPLPALANEEHRIEATIAGIATAADAQDWDRLDLKFADHVMLNQLSLATTQGARVNEQTVVETWAGLLPLFDSTRHEISEIEILGVTSVIAKATARYAATYHLNGQTWLQQGRLDYLLKHTDQGWQVTAMNTTPEWENQPLAAVLGTTLQ
ncbi:MAG: nuclear transport factor 2 family protein [Roseobacter sp.]|jgi:hypothetical protein|nr:nuclear transport factor 2 family protein [Roseobacter sp.]